jgi:hypothetical protein
MRAARRLGHLARACVAAAALAAGASATGPAAAAPFLVELGGVRVALDAPAGFADTGFTGSPRLRELAESLTPASNRVLLFALTDSDLRSFTVGDAPELRRYLLAVTPRSYEREWVSPTQFSAFVGESLRELGPRAPDGNLRKHLDAQALGQVSALADLRKDRDIVSVLQGVRLPPLDPDNRNAPPRYMLSTTTLVWMRGKALSLSVFTSFDGPADVDWIVSATRRWVDDLVRLNSR